MNVVILGSGVIGTTAAYYLTKANHEVTVLGLTIARSGATH